MVENMVSGRMIRMFRLTNNLTQSGLAKIINTSDTKISEWENEIRPIKQNQLNALLKSASEHDLDTSALTNADTAARLKQDVCALNNTIENQEKTISRLIMENERLWKVISGLLTLQNSKSVQTAASEGVVPDPSTPCLF